MTIASRIRVRWMIRRDLPDVSEIDLTCREVAQAEGTPGNRWSAEDYEEFIRERNNIVMVAENDGGNVVGVMAYQLTNEEIALVRLGVFPTYRRLGIGSLLVNSAKRKLDRRPRIVAEVHEKRLEMQLFLRAVGFVAYQLVSNCYNDGGDGYLFEYRGDNG